MNDNFMKPPMPNNEVIETLNGLVFGNFKISAKEREALARAVTIIGIIDRLMSFASAEPERKTGEWKKITKHYKDAEREVDYYEIRCSVCNNPPEKTWHMTRFCPHCGAMMKGE